MTYWKHKDRYYREVEAGEWTTLVPIEVKEAASIASRRVGIRIPMSLWRQSLSFLGWSYKTNGSESLVNFYYHEEEGWRALVLPQNGCQGMQVEVLEDHPRWAELHRQFQGSLDDRVNTKPWKPFATAHHHCDISAFASSGDKKDEATKEGLHITIGDMSKPRYSIHARACFAGEALPAVLEDWLELDDWMAAVVPPELHGQLLAIQLVTPVDEPFPEEWKENVIKVERKSVWPTPLPGTHSGYSQLPAHYQGGKDAADFHRSHHWGFGRLEFKSQIKELVRDYGTDLRDLSEMVDELSLEPHSTLIDAMVECNIDLKGAEQIVEGLIEDDRDEAGKSNMEKLTDEEIEAAWRAGKFDMGS